MEEKAEKIEHLGFLLKLSGKLSLFRNALLSEGYMNGNDFALNSMWSRFP